MSIQIFFVLMAFKLIVLIIVFGVPILVVLVAYFAARGLRETFRKT